MIARQKKLEHSNSYVNYSNVFKAVEARMESGEVDSEEDEENLLRAMNDAEARKNAEKNVRLHEAFQFLLKKRERM